MKTSEFKKIIKECVREVLTEELKGIKRELSEQRKVIQPIQKVGGFEAPNYSKINSQPIPSTIEPTLLYENTGNPLIDLLNETKYNTNSEEWNNFGHFDNSKSFNRNEFLPKNEPIVGTVNQMISNAPKSGDINQIEIDIVPNFSNLMGKLKEQGQI